ncbi:DUF1932 domain-containing protein [Sphingobacterium corticibacter]|uniref:NAD(P)-dependent oxidoreductase n=1 Tax=Sphingobacterium corticibacter TaxID=2171749 RepID=A0A2T8HHG2_9SPHI|nr:NAD(P)-binding domain-containing protein [Sphingobacterium corticibacter]PVH24855.1 hypothetical protein DC487_12100 [Sphingobacterium corticibacter]
MTKVAILYPGDMGVNIAKLLIEKGFDVYSDLDERSESTRKKAFAIGVQQLSINEIVSEVDFVVSLVPPSAVKDVAQAYIDACDGQNRIAMFVDMNAKSTDMVKELSTMFKAVDVPFINACVIGRAAFLRDEGVVYYSGEQVVEWENLINNILEIKYLGDQVTAATAFKMCFAGFNKTITAVFFEIATAANHFGITDELFEEINRKMSGTMGDISKIVGNYPKHINRRKQEMSELNNMLVSENIYTKMASAAALTFEEIADKQYFRSLKEEGSFSLMTILKKLS